MADWVFHTPGWVDDDLPTSVKDEWHRWHVAKAKRNLDQMRGLVEGGAEPVVPYVSPTTAEVPGRRTTVPVEWEGFPAQVAARFENRADALEATIEKGNLDLPQGPPPAGTRWAFVDQGGNEVDCGVRHRQDEYLEWEARWDDGVLRSLTFVAEGYDYWGFLFEQDPEYVATAYEDLASVPGLTADGLRFPDDLDLYVVPLAGGQPELVERGVFRRGAFNPRNQVNQGPGIVHLSHHANSLAAEINLAITSSLPRLDASGRLVIADPVQKLMCCTGGGDPNRSSDPHIASAAYSQVVDKDDPKFFTLTDPVGLYIRSFKHRALQDPSGKPAPYEFWQTCRGKDATDRADRGDSRILRLHLEVPDGEGFRLGDMKIDGRAIAHPSELAELVDMHLLVDVWPATGVASRVSCRGTCCEQPSGLLVPTARPSACAGSGLVDAFPGLVADELVAHEPSPRLAGRR